MDGAHKANMVRYSDTILATVVRREQPWKHITTKLSSGREDGKIIPPFMLNPNAADASTEILMRYC